MASDTLVSVFGGAMISSARSTFVRRWPSVPLSVWNRGLVGVERIERGEL